MKFVSWNVNGLRACIQKGFLEEFQNLDADFFCLQETKLSEGQLKLDTPGYEQYWCYADKKGYSGTAIFTRHTPLSVSYGIGVPELDHEGRVIALEYQEFYLVTCYTPNAQRGLARLEYRMKWDDAFRAYLKKLDESKPVILCGDLNVAHKEIDLKNPNSNRGNAGFSDEERSSFQRTLDAGFTDTFRHLYPNATGRYSWWSYMYHARENNAGWRIDYFLVSDRLQDAIHQADIHSDIYGSDHCPVSLDLDIAVNGSIWSPNAKGEPKVTYPPEKPKKEPKASAVNAKALVVFLVIFTIAAGGILFLWKPIDDHFTPQIDQVSFDLEVYYWPFESGTSDIFDVLIGGSGSLIIDGGNDFTGSTVLPITDGTATYYVPNVNTEILSASNTALRITLSEEAKALDAQWSVLLTSYSGTDHSLYVHPYFNDISQQDPGGWLIWGNLDTETAFDLTIRSQSVVEPYTDTVNLVPYLDNLTCNNMTTEELAEYVANHDYLFNTLVQDGETDLSFISMHCPALNHLAAREDAVHALMNLTCQGDAAYLVQALLSLDIFRQIMTPEEEAAYLTFCYVSCPFLSSSSDILYDYSNVTTEVMLSEVIFTSPFQWSMEACTSKESASLIYDYYINHLQVLQELELQEDTVPLLLQYVTSEWSKPAMYLLTVDVYAEQLSPEDTAVLYSSIWAHSTELFNSMLGIDPDQQTLRQLTAEQLATYIAHNSTLCRQVNALRYDDLLDIQASYEALCAEYPVLLELQSRDDAVQTLMNSPYVSDTTLVSVLLQTLTYQQKMTPREEADYLTKQYLNTDKPYTHLKSNWDVDSLSTEELVVYMGINEKSLLYSCSCAQSREYVYEFLLEHSQLLQALETREDAVAVLMNIPYTDGSISHFLLQLPVYREIMTSDEEAAFLSNDYPSYPTEILYG